jgi:sec-independent protein translocase protein TatC
MGADLRHTAPAEDQDDPREGRMGFLDHLDELRKRIIYSSIAIGVGMLISFFFVDRIAAFVMAPTLRALPPGSELIYTRASEGFSFLLDVAFIGGIVLAAPFVTYQVWLFIAPGLYAHEKKFAVPFMLLASIGALCGAAFSHYVLFPGMMSFFATVTLPHMKFMPRVEDNFDQYMKMLIGMVVVFQMPTLVFFLARLRLVTARFLWRHIKYAILGIFIAAAVLTSSADAWNQAMFAAPMIALYVLSIGVAWLVAPKGENDRAASGSTTIRLVVGAMVIDQARRLHGPARLQSSSAIERRHAARGRPYRY